MGIFSVWVVVMNVCVWLWFVFLLFCSVVFVLMGVLVVRFGVYVMWLCIFVIS